MGSRQGKAMRWRRIPISVLVQLVAMVLIALVFAFALMTSAVFFEMLDRYSRSPASGSARQVAALVGVLRFSEAVWREPGLHGRSPADSEHDLARSNSPTRRRAA